jgi:hypothetical protein
MAHLSTASFPTQNVAFDKQTVTVAPWAITQGGTVLYRAWTGQVTAMLDWVAVDSLHIKNNIWIPAI